MSRKFLRSSEQWDLEEQMNELVQMGYREVEGLDLQPGEFRKTADVDDFEHRPVFTLEWEDGARV